MSTSWDDIARAIIAERKGKDSQPARGRCKRALNAFIEWVGGMGVTVEDVAKGTAIKPLHDDYVESLFEAYTKRRGEGLSSEGVALKDFALEMLKRGQAVKVEIEAEKPTTEEEPNEEPKEEPTPMSNPNPPPEYDDEQIDPDDEGEDTDVDTLPPAKRRMRTTQQTQQPIVIMPQQQQRQTRPRGAAPQTAVRKMLGRTEKIRVFKREVGGKRIYVADYTMDDLGDKQLVAFLKEDVDPEFGDASGRTTYEVAELDVNNREKPGSGTYTIEAPRSSVAQNSPNDPIDQLRGAAQLINELKEDERDRTQEQMELLTEAKKKALSGGDVNMNQLMMLMMMEKMMGGKGSDDDKLLFKVAEMFKRSGASPGGDFGAPQGLNGMMMPPWAAAPPPPLAPAPHVPTAMDKIVELAVAKMMNPPEPKSLAESLKELMVFKEMMGGGGELSAIRAELAAMRADASKPKEVGGIDGALGTFERLSAVVQTLAPKLNMGGISGALQNIITPKLGEAVGNMLAASMAKPGVNGQNAPQLQVAQRQQLLARQQPQQALTEEKLPASVEAALTAARVAVMENTKVEATVDLMQTMLEAKFQMQALEPAIAHLMQGKFEIPRRVVSGVVDSVKPGSATPLFVDKVIVSIIKRTGNEVPELFAKNLGKWTVTAQGEVVPSADATFAPAVVKEPSETMKVEEKVPVVAASAAPAELPKVEPATPEATPTPVPEPKPTVPAKFPEGRPVREVPPLVHEGDDGNSALPASA